MNGLVPDWLDTDRQYERFHHFDLPYSETQELLRELYALRPLLWWKLEDNWWLCERCEALEAELAKRHDWKLQGVRGG
jgi:hypothetical protein